LRSGSWSTNVAGWGAARAASPSTAKNVQVDESKAQAWLPEAGNSRLSFVGKPHIVKQALKKTGLLYRWSPPTSPRPQGSGFGVRAAARDPRQGGTSGIGSTLDRARLRPAAAGGRAQNYTATTTKAVSRATTRYGKRWSAGRGRRWGAPGQERADQTLTSPTSGAGRAGPTWTCMGGGSPRSAKAQATVRSAAEQVEIAKAGVRQFGGRSSVIDVEERALPHSAEGGIECQSR